MAAGSSAAPAVSALPAVSLKDVDVVFRLADGGTYKAVTGASLDVADGEFVAMGVEGHCGVVSPWGCLGVHLILPRAGRVEGKITNGPLGVSGRGRWLLAVGC